MQARRRRWCHWPRRSIASCRWQLLRYGRRSTRRWKIFAACGLNQQAHEQKISTMLLFYALEEPFQKEPLTGIFLAQDNSKGHSHSLENKRESLNRGGSDDVAIASDIQQRLKIACTFFVSIDHQHMMSSRYRLSLCVYSCLRV